MSKRDSCHHHQWHEDESLEESLMHEHNSPEEETGIRQCPLSIGCFSPKFISLCGSTVNWTSSTASTHYIRRQWTISSDIPRSYPCFHLSAPLALGKKYRNYVLLGKEIFQWYSYLLMNRSAHTLRLFIQPRYVCSKFTFYNTWHRIQISSIIRIKNVQIPISPLLIIFIGPQHYFCLDTDI